MKRCVCERSPGRHSHHPFKHFYQNSYRQMDVRHGQNPQCHPHGVKSRRLPSSILQKRGRRAAGAPICPICLFKFRPCLRLLFYGNDFPLDFNGVSVQMDVQGTRFATGLATLVAMLNAFGETIIDVPVTISVFGIYVPASKSPFTDFYLASMQFINLHNLLLP
jgi:hypothetical protein